MLEGMDNKTKIRESDRGKEIYDPLRKKWLLLTPEEGVRQYFCSFLQNEKGYPSGLMANELTLKLNGNTKRCDTVIYDSSLRPKMIVEYKAPEVSITQEVFEQICRYNIVLGVDYLTVFNGKKLYCLKSDKNTGKYTFLNDLPSYSEL